MPTRAAQLSPAVDARMTRHIDSVRRRALGQWLGPRTEAHGLVEELVLPVHSRDLAASHEPKDAYLGQTAVVTVTARPDSAPESDGSPPEIRGVGSRFFPLGKVLRLRRGLADLTLVQPRPVQSSSTAKRDLPTVSKSTAVLTPLGSSRNRRRRCTTWTPQLDWHPRSWHVAQKVWCGCGVSELTSPHSGQVESC